MKQLVQVVGTPLSPFLDPPGLAGREGTVLLTPDSGGELGEDCTLVDALWRASAAVFGVDTVRGIFCLRGSESRLRISLTDAAEPCPRPKLPPWP